jgi:hypothetical protein
MGSAAQKPQVSRLYQAAKAPDDFFSAAQLILQADFRGERLSPRKPAATI